MRELRSKIKSEGCCEEKAYLLLNITSKVKIMKPYRIEPVDELEYANTRTKLVFVTQNGEWISAPCLIWCRINISLKNKFKFTSLVVVLCAS